MENGPSDDGTPSPDSEDYLTPLQRQQGSERVRSDPSRQASRDSDPRLLNNSSNSSNKHREIIQNQQNVQRMRNSVQGSGIPSGFNPARLPAQNQPDVERWLASQPPDGSRGRLRSDESDHIPDSPSPPGSYHSDETFQQHG